MLTRRVADVGTRDDRIQERIKQSSEGLSQPWTPPDQTKDCWGKPIKPKKKRLSNATIAKHAHMNLEA